MMTIRAALIISGIVCLFPMNIAQAEDCFEVTKRATDLLQHELQLSDLKDLEHIRDQLAPCVKDSDQLFRLKSENLLVNVEGRVERINESLGSSIRSCSLATSPIECMATCTMWQGQARWCRENYRNEHKIFEYATCEQSLEMLETYFNTTSLDSEKLPVNSEARQTEFLNVLSGVLSNIARTKEKAKGDSECRSKAERLLRDIVRPSARVRELLKMIAKGNHEAEVLVKELSLRPPDERARLIEFILGMFGLWGKEVAEKVSMKPMALAHLLGALSRYSPEEQSQLVEMLRQASESERRAFLPVLLETAVGMAADEGSDYITTIRQVLGVLKNSSSPSQRNAILNALPFLTWDGMKKAMAELRLDGGAGQKLEELRVYDFNATSVNTDQGEVVNGAMLRAAYEFVGQNPPQMMNRVQSNSEFYTVVRRITASEKPNVVFHVKGEFQRRENGCLVNVRLLSPKGTLLFVSSVYLRDDWDNTRCAQELRRTLESFTDFARTVRLSHPALEVLPTDYTKRVEAYVAKGVYTRTLFRRTGSSVIVPVTGVYLRGDLFFQPNESHPLFGNEIRGLLLKRINDRYHTEGLKILTHTDTPGPMDLWVSGSYSPRSSDGETKLIIVYSRNNQEQIAETVFTITDESLTSDKNKVRDAILAQITESLASLIGLTYQPRRQQASLLTSFFLPGQARIDSYETPPATLIAWNLSNPLLLALTVGLEGYFILSNFDKNTEWAYSGGIGTLGLFVINGSVGVWDAVRWNHTQETIEGGSRSVSRGTVLPLLAFSFDF